MTGLFSDFSWGAPHWLFALILLPVIAGIFAWAEGRRRQLLQRLVAVRLQSALAGNISVVKRRVRFGLILGALASLIVALGQPRYGYTFEEVKRKGRDVLIAIDTSRSMLATDVAPNRLTRAKFAALDFLNSLEGDRAGLIAFAGSAFLQAPLTVDYTAVISSINELDTNVIPVGGTNIAEAIETAIKAFGKGEGESRCLVLFTDGEELDPDAVAAARKAAGSMRIFTVGVGSADGSLIPVPSENGGTEFVKDQDGNFVKSRLDETKLRQIAELTGGFYVRLQDSPIEMKRIVDQGLGQMKENEFDARTARHPIERYQWPLGLGLALLMAGMFIGERRRSGAVVKSKPPTRATLAVSVLMGLWMLGGTAKAANPSGEELYRQGKFEEAGKLYESELKRLPNSPGLRFNKGTTEYGLGDYNAAIDNFSRALQSGDPGLRGKAEYNLGTALLQRALKRDEQKEETEKKADLSNAIQHFDQALKLEPKNGGALANRTVAKKELTKPKPTPPPSDKNQKNDDKKDDKKDDQKDNKNQQSKNQQSKDQQSKDQQSKDQQSKDQQSKDQQSKDQQSKDQQSKDQQSKDEQQQTPSDKNQASDKQQHERPSGTPPPTTDEKKLEGEIKAQDSKKPDGKPEEQAQVEVAEKPGEMSENQARAVLDSLKGEDDQPFKPEQRSSAPVLKDW